MRDPIRSWSWLAALASLASLSLATVRLGGDGRFGGESERAADTGSPAPIDFALEIRPLLSDRCFKCHGQDARARKAGLRLDTEVTLHEPLASGERAVVAGDLAQSALWQRISSADDDERMPPKSSGKTLAPAEIERLRRWIEEGATWQPHWSFRRVERPVPPATSHDAWCRNPIDRFVVERLEREGLAPAAEESRERLLRRVTLDLTGLPPSLEELEAFASDTQADAYERAVDRLLASKRYAEQMTRSWLDLARYGDTHGLHLDNERSLWPWRDWVLRAFDANMPFDRFTIEQLAGDLLDAPGAPAPGVPSSAMSSGSAVRDVAAQPKSPGELATALSPEVTDRIVATGFQRCNPTTGEGGSIEQESLTRYAVDRVSTTSTVWLGLTMACAQCHDHRFDPITQRDYYRFYGFFSNVDERGSDENDIAPPPVVPVPSAAQRAEFARLIAERHARESDLVAPDPAMDAEEASWREEWARRLAKRWTTIGESVRSREKVEFARLSDGSFLASGANPEKDVDEVTARIEPGVYEALSLEALTHASLPFSGPGRSSNNGNFVLTEIEVGLVGDACVRAPLPIELARASAEFEQPGFASSGAIDGESSSGWAIDGGQADRRAVFAFAQPLEVDEPATLRIRLRFESKYPGHGIGRMRLALGSDRLLAPSELSSWQSAGPYTDESASKALTKAFAPELEGQPGAERVAWKRRPELIDGELHSLDGEVSAFYFRRTIWAPSERVLDVAVSSDDAVALWLNGVRVHVNDTRRGLEPDQDRLRLRLRAGANEVLLKVVNDRGGAGFGFRVTGEELGGLPLDVASALERSDHAASGGSNVARLVREHFRARHSERGAQLARAVNDLREAEAKLDKEVVRSMVLRERTARRPLQVLERGQYDKPGESVTRGWPEFLLPANAAAAAAVNAPANAAPDATASAQTNASEPTRLDLARWLVSRDHPLTARVTVNRFWQQHFGTGLVETAEDFGAQGTPPSHPKLLDWLAAEFMESGWDVKRMQRLIVTSATYRQSASANNESWQRDPGNRLLARGPRLRLDAEEIRDQALFASGLLVESFGGKSVRPYQPSGLWEAVAYPISTTAKYERDRGPGLWRRSLYTFWKRTQPPASMQVFDAPTREACTVKRARTNTPLQALALLNDEQLSEAARSLAARALRSAGTDAAHTLERAFRLVLTRAPDARERDVLLALHARELAQFRARPGDAQASLKLGDTPADAELDPIELAAWTGVARAILNLDEAVTRG